MRTALVLALVLSSCGTNTTNLVPSPLDSAAVPGLCAPAGSACSVDPDCCAGAMPPLHCKPDGAGLTTHHCEGAPTKPCGAMGESCAPADCCGPGMTCTQTDGGALCAPAI